MDTTQGLFYGGKEWISSSISQLQEQISVPEPPSIHSSSFLDFFSKDRHNFRSSQLLFQPTQEKRHHENQHSEFSKRSQFLFNINKEIIDLDNLPDVEEKRDYSSEEDLFDEKVENFHQSTPAAYTPNHFLAQRYDGSSRSQQLMKLRAVSEIPKKFRNIFDFPYFNNVQSEIIDDALYSDKSLVVCAPTGAGKTVIFELAIVRLLVKYQDLQHGCFKVVYMAPIKALCSERYSAWQRRFEPVGLKCKELTGDSEIDDYNELQNMNIIITTPEKWDSMTRRWRNNRALIQQLQLFMIDEVHTLNDSTRGATMEAVISRMKTINVAAKWVENNSETSNIRFIAVSATIVNITDIADWLGEKHKPAVNYKMGDSYRPVRLRRVVLGFHCADNISDFQFDLSLSYKLLNVITTYSDGKPTLVFCSTRKGVQQAADIVSKNSRFVQTVQEKDKLQKYANLLKDSKLRDYVMHGIGCHHAGMDIQDRKHIVEMFENGDLHVLMATSTLAMGINLPAHLVIVKSTQYYQMGILQEYGDSQVLQMIGRAGRPQFDSTATAVIMTKNKFKAKYEDLINGTQLIESSLHKHLIEHLNAEIVLNTINDISVGVEWIKHTFLYTRVRKNPQHYGISQQLNEEQLEKYLQDLCLRNLNLLAGIKLIQMNSDNFGIQSTEMGKLMAKYYIAFDTMQRFCQISGNEAISDLLALVSESAEFADTQLRNNEKRTLNSLNKDKNKITIRFSMNGRIKTKEMKINCLIQAHLGCLPIQDFSLIQDINRIFRAGQRVARCLIEVLWLKDDYKVLVNAVNLYKCFKSRIWENSKYVAKQLDGIGQSLSTVLVNAGIISFKQIEETNPRELELIMNRHPPFGNHLRDAVVGLPKYELSVEQVDIINSKVESAVIVITVRIANIDQLKRSTVGENHTCALIIGNADNKIIYKRRVVDSTLLQENPLKKRLEVTRADGGPEIHIHLISQEWAGIDVVSIFTPTYRNSFAQQSNYFRRTGENKHIYCQSEPKQDEGSEKRPCNHRCLDKSRCAHKCCKFGWKGHNESINKQETSVINTTTYLTYVDGLKKKMKNFPDTPKLKRLKIQKQEETSFDFKKFAYTTKQKLHLPKKDQNFCNMRTDANHCDIIPEGCGWEPLHLFEKNRDTYQVYAGEKFYGSNALGSGYTKDSMTELNPKRNAVPDDFDDYNNDNIYGSFFLETNFVPSSPAHSKTHAEQVIDFGSKHSYGQVPVQVLQKTTEQFGSKTTLPDKEKMAYLHSIGSFWNSNADNFPRIDTQPGVSIHTDSSQVTSSQHQQVTHQNDRPKLKPKSLSTMFAKDFDAHEYEKKTGGSILNSIFDGIF